MNTREVIQDFRASIATPHYPYTRVPVYTPTGVKKEE